MTDRTTKHPTASRDVKQELIAALSNPSVISALSEDLKPLISANVNDAIAGELAAIDKRVKAMEQKNMEQEKRINELENHVKSDTLITCCLPETTANIKHTYQTLAGGAINYQQNDSNFSNSSPKSYKSVGSSVSSTSSTISYCSQHFMKTEKTVWFDAVESFSIEEVRLIPEELSPNASLSGSHYCDPSSCDGCSYLSKLECNKQSDWRIANESFSEPTPAIPNDIVKPVKPVSAILPAVTRLTDRELREKLITFGERPGPVGVTTRRTFELKLTSLMLNSSAGPARSSHKAEFPTEITQALSGLLDISSLAYLEEDMRKPFIYPEVGGTVWREGGQKASFMYLLLDPRVTQNLPVRAKTLPQSESFGIFLRAVFYVGKGKSSRPYKHLKKATTLSKTPVSAKAHQIRDIWMARLGVVSLQVFHNIIPVEAYTREACVIEALGLERLSNKRKGSLYGPAEHWPKGRVRQLGVVLLNSAFNVLLHDGERQIRVQDAPR